VNQLKGSVSAKVRSLREDILYEIAFIESALDDPEHISLEGYPDKLMAKTRGLSQELKKLIDSADNGKMLKDGIRTVILGKPNAGKSSLLNVLVGEDKAIVTSVAGTTRDVLEESIKLHGIGLNMIDTAGIRDTEDEVEKIGVEKARKYANQADLVIYVVDSSRELDENDEEIIELIRDKKVIVLLNKTDLEPVVTEEQIKDKFREIYEGEEKHDDSLHVIRTSTKDNTGIDEFEKTIQDMFFAGRIAVNDEIYITNQRHKEALVEAYDSLKMVQKSLEDEMPEDFYSIDLMSAYASLGRIIGEEVGEDLVNEIFSKFCMGK
jgi:tRNA modification GTPase